MLITQLPRELISLILQNLNPADRLKCSLTCRNLAEHVSCSPSLDDVWRIIHGSDTEGVIKSQRQYRNMRIFGANLPEYNVEFWEKVGRHLHCLELIECNSTPEVLKSITRHCPELKSLEVKEDGILKNQFIFSSEIFLAHHGAKSDEVQHLATDSDHITEETTEHLLASMPRAASFSLPSLHSRHGLPYLLRARHTFTKLEITCPALSEEDVMALVGMYSESLHELQLNCQLLTDAAYPAICDCRRLRHLTLILAFKFGDSHLEKLVRNVPELETLEFNTGCATLTDVGLAHIHNLKGLRNLGLRSIWRLTIDAIRRAVGIPTLRHLHIDGQRIDVTVIRNIGSLKDLRVLRLIDMFRVDSESFRIICRKLGMLEELWLENCHQLTDADAVNLCRLTRLKSLHLRNCFLFTDLFFANRLGSPAMEYLELFVCPLSCVGLASLAAHHSQLRGLTLSFCDEIKDAGLAILLQNEPFLEKLELVFCRSLTDGFLRDFGNSCPRLRHLMLRGCSTSAEALELFKTRRPLVRVSI